MAVPALDTPPNDTAFVPNSADVRSSIAQADEIIIGRLITADFSDPKPDRFATSTRWLIERSLKGNLLPNSTLGIRLPLGPEAASHTPMPKPGERFLLLLSRAEYERQVRSRGGSAEPGFTGAGLGFYRIVNGEIDKTFIRTPADAAALQALLGGKGIE